MAVLLDSSMLSAVHLLLAADAEAGTLLPSAAVSSLERLIGADTWGVGEADRTGFVFRWLEFPHVDYGAGIQACDGPLTTGLEHDAALPPDQMSAAEIGMRDHLRLGFSTGTGTVVQLFFERRRRPFSADEAALLRMLEPAIGRLVRASASAPSSGALTQSERQVLTLVAQGCSNREIAEELFVTVHTVRKHLENAYRKLGVTNRTAAALRVRSA